MVLASSNPGNLVGGASVRNLRILGTSAGPDFSSNRTTFARDPRTGTFNVVSEIGRGGRPGPTGPKPITTSIDASGTVFVNINNQKRALGGKFETSSGATRQILVDPTTGEFRDVQIRSSKGTTTFSQERLTRFEQATRARISKLQSSGVGKPSIEQPSRTPQTTTTKPKRAITGASSLVSSGLLTGSTPTPTSNIIQRTSTRTPVKRLATTSSGLVTGRFPSQITQAPFRQPVNVTFLPEGSKQKKKLTGLGGGLTQTGLLIGTKPSESLRKVTNLPSDPLKRAIVQSSGNVFLASGQPIFSSEEIRTLGTQAVIDFKEGAKEEFKAIKRGGQDFASFVTTPLKGVGLQVPKPKEVSLEDKLSFTLAASTPLIGLGINLLKGVGEGAIIGSRAAKTINLTGKAADVAVRTGTAGLVLFNFGNEPTAKTLGREAGFVATVEGGLFAGRSTIKVATFLDPRFDPNIKFESFAKTGTQSEQLRPRRKKEVFFSATRAEGQELFPQGDKLIVKASKGKDVSADRAKFDEGKLGLFFTEKAISSGFGQPKGTAPPPLNFFRALRLEAKVKPLPKTTADLAFAKPGKTKTRFEVGKVTKTRKNVVNPGTKTGSGSGTELEFTVAPDSVLVREPPRTAFEALLKKVGVKQPASRVALDPISGARVSIFDVGFKPKGKKSVKSGKKSSVRDVAKEVAAKARDAPKNILNQIKAKGKSLFDVPISSVDRITGRELRPTSSRTRVAVARSSLRVDTRRTVVNDRFVSRDVARDLRRGFDTEPRRIIDRTRIDRRTRTDDRLRVPDDRRLLRRDLIRIPPPTKLRRFTSGGFPGGFAQPGRSKLGKAGKKPGFKVRASATVLAGFAKGIKVKKGQQLTGLELRATKLKVLPSQGFFGAKIKAKGITGLFVRGKKEPKSKGVTGLFKRAVKR